MAVELVIVEQFVPALEKYNCLLVQDCHSIQKIGGLFCQQLICIQLICLQEYLLIATKSRQSVSTVSAKLSLSAVTAVTVLKTVIPYSISSTVTVCCYNCYCTKTYNPFTRSKQFIFCVFLYLYFSSLLKLRS